MSNQTRDLQKAVTTILRALKIAETEIRVAHKELNFQAVEIQTLRYLSEHPSCRLSELGSFLGIVPTTASSVVDRLVERDLVERRRPETDRRSIALSLTADGREAFGRLEAEEMVTMQVMLDALPEDERETFVRQMTRIADKVSI
jgi:DNA-binding MarR family transcriptional regulator